MTDDDTARLGEVEPELRRAAKVEKECQDSGNELFNVGATDILVRHFGKEGGK